MILIIYSLGFITMKSLSRLELVKKYPIDQEQAYKKFSHDYRKLIKLLKNTNPETDPLNAHQIHQDIFHLPHINDYGIEKDIGDLHFNDYHNLVSVFNQSDDEQRKACTKEIFEQLDEAERCYKLAQNLVKKDSEAYIVLEANLNNIALERRLRLVDLAPWIQNSDAEYEFDENASEEMSIACAEDDVTSNSDSDPDWITRFESPNQDMGSFDEIRNMQRANFIALQKDALALCEQATISTEEESLLNDGISFGFRPI